MSDEEDEWDFYPCRVDDEPASISVNLRFESVEPDAVADTRYRVRIEMLYSGTHGMGNAAEADVLHPFEDHVVEAAKVSGLIKVGRLRTRGWWDLVFYGPADRLDGLAQFANGVGGRKVEIGSKADSGWDFYREFLLPDAERRQWMQDRKIVELMKAEGDPLLPRRVDHWAYFPTADTRDAFVAELRREGFDLALASDHASGELKYGAHLHRVDSAQLAEIHDVVMLLYAAAQRHDGDYDGWESSIEAPQETS
jgi:hypothetical protein